VWSKNEKIIQIQLFMTHNDYNALIDAHPELTATGYGIDYHYIEGTPEYASQWNAERALLYEFYPMLEHCLAWINNNKDLVLDPDCFGRKRNTKMLKGLAEHELFNNGISPRYIPQGTFIIAALSNGYEIDQIEHGGPNVTLRK
jgi:hypothetical protein